MRPLLLMYNDVMTSDLQYLVNLLRWTALGNFLGISMSLNSSLSCYFHVIFSFHNNSMLFPQHFQTISKRFHVISMQFPSSMPHLTFALFPYDFQVPCHTIPSSMPHLHNNISIQFLSSILHSSMLFPCHWHYF